MITAIIPARGGSKGLPRKNIRQIAGFPLIYWTIKAAQQSRLLDEVYVSTEDSEIASIARSCGAQVLNRPEHLAQDTTTTLEVLRDCLSHLSCDTVVVLQPTSPLRNSDTIDSCISEYLAGGYDTLATGHTVKTVEYGTHDNMRRQDINGFFYDDGNVYIISRAVLDENRWSGFAICRKELPRELRYEIDDAIDFFIVEALLKKRLMEGTQPSEVHSRAAEVKLLVMDVDGVLTDGAMYYSESGDELKKFTTIDGMGISFLHNAGIATALITGEKTSLITRRSRKLSIDYVFQGVTDKLSVLNKLIQTLGITNNETGYIGDDLNDLEVMNNVGFPVTVPNGHEKLKKVACYCTEKPGGSGAVREVCELILQARNA